MGVLSNHPCFTDVSSRLPIPWYVVWRYMSKLGVHVDSEAIIAIAVVAVLVVGSVGAVMLVNNGSSDSIDGQ